MTNAVIFLRIMKQAPILAPRSRLENVLKFKVVLIQGVSYLWNITFNLKTIIERQKRIAPITFSNVVDS